MGSACLSPPARGLTQPVRRPCDTNARAINRASEGAAGPAGSPIQTVAEGGWYREAVAPRREDLNAEQLGRQRALDRSWVEAERELADPEFRGYLEDSIRRLDAKEPAPVLTREEFLEQTAVSDA